MAMASVGGLIGLALFLFMILLPVALLVALQVWLCRKSVKLGLILPGISLALSLIFVLSIAAFSRATVGGGALRVTDENGNVIREEMIPAPETETEHKIELAPRTLAAAGVIFLVSNIPTAVFGGIWLHCKGRRDTYEDLKRMQIEDLE